MRIRRKASGHKHGGICPCPFRATATAGSSKPCQLGALGRSQVEARNPLVHTMAGCFPAVHRDPREHLAGTSRIRTCKLKAWFLLEISKLASLSSQRTILRRLLTLLPSGDSTVACDWGIRDNDAIREPVAQRPLVYAIMAASVREGVNDGTLLRSSVTTASARTGSTVHVLRNRRFERKDTSKPTCVVKFQRFYEARRQPVQGWRRLLYRRASDATAYVCGTEFSSTLRVA